MRLFMNRTAPVTHQGVNTADVITSGSAVLICSSHTRLFGSVGDTLIDVDARVGGVDRHEFEIRKITRHRS